jgi:ABC-type glycerol-3-phosphate transport system substrate-binding protein
VAIRAFSPALLRYALISCLLIGWLCVGDGCGQASPTAPAATPTLTPRALETPTPTLSPTATAVPPGAPQTLTVWITELASPLDGGERALIFERQIKAFEATHPGLTIEIIYKKPDGTGGMGDFATTASAVAPAVMPDLLMIDQQDLPGLAAKGLAVPLDDLLAPELLADLYPFAIQAGTVEDQLVGVPFETSIEHALYNTSKIAVPPASWTEVFSSGATYVFPTLGQDGLVNDAFLIQYLSAGAELLEPSGDPALDQQALSDVLGFYRTGIENGAILTDVLEYDTVRSGWRKYLQAEVVMSNMTSDLYFEGRGLLRVSKATAIPTRDGQPPVALARGSAWVLTTSDVNRQPLAVKLLSWLLSPYNMASWSQAAGLLPTRRAAFEQMPRDDDEYVSFVYKQLEYAMPYPASETHLRLYRAMQQAVNAVLRDDELPAAAAQGILQSVGQETIP